MGHHSNICAALQEGGGEKGECSLLWPSSCFSSSQSHAKSLEFTFAPLAHAKGGGIGEAEGLYSVRFNHFCQRQTL